jgi:DNA-binding MurR/RpiR family transcriptional regulator
MTEEIELTKNEKIILKAIYHANNKGENPTDEELAKATGLSVNEVATAARFLTQIGYAVKDADQ